MNVSRIRILALVLMASLSAPTSTALAGEPVRPNVVLLLIDDGAFMDLGAFGGEAHTPNIDALAASGAILTNYHTSPLCSPSRAMLLTGIDNHRTGVSTIEEVLPPELEGKPGYTLHLEPGVVTVASRLKKSGYHTFMVGKWHLGHGTGDLPSAHGFDQSFALDASGADNWEQKPYMPYYQIAPWYENGKPADLPKDFYSSKFLVDRMMRYIDSNRDRASPFFAYVAFQAVHIPVQAPREFSDRYKGRFDDGWDKLRADRWERAKTLGLIPANAALAPMPTGSRSWSSLSPDERKIYARSMEVYSGMLEAMDYHVGRLVAHLRGTGQFDNTVFIVTSDNGPEPSDPVHAPGMNLWMMTHGYDWKDENLGEKGSLNYIGPEWAAAAASPGKLFKFYTAEGGLHVPFVISGPGVKAGSKLEASAFVTDVTPTILQLAGVPVTQETGQVQITGHSLLALLSGSSSDVRPQDESVGTEVSGNSALFRGHYKIVRYAPPHGDNSWHLFDVTMDPGETNDLSESHSDLMKSMLADYTAYEKRMGVLPLPKGYDVQKQVLKNAIARQLKAYWWVLAIAAAFVVVLVVLLFRFVAGRMRG
ncbi:MAG: arylsulfatase [Micropepsaceae bacterium]